jgi:alkylation response protein AidB-like acyl-CoA dehydrogenase
MRFALSAEQAELRNAARRYLATHWPSAQVRAVIDAGAEASESSWKAIAKELGWPALLVPEAQGGLGLGWTEACILAEETGRTLACIPFLSTVCMATGALLAAESNASTARFLAGIATGTMRVALAYSERANADPMDVATTAREAGGEYVLSGTKRYVVDGSSADVLLVSARSPGTSDAEGLALYAVPAGTRGLELERTPSIDGTRSLATVTLREARLDRSARVGDGAALRRAVDRASIALAAECLGGAERCVEVATAYAKTRVQFDRPIGSFQAIKHKLADLFTAVETTRSAVRYAADAADRADDAELAVAAALAKSYATEAFFRCAAESIQVHGGIGFTWEHDAHLFLKRARGSLVLLGPASWDRERIARDIGLGAAEVR